MRLFNQTHLRKHRSSGFTLVELLIAMTITLLLMAALGKSFAVIGRTMNEGRSKVTLSSKLRGATFRLRSDLNSMTVDGKASISTEAGQGYFTYYEGPLTEQTMALYADAPRRDLNGETIFQFLDPDLPAVTATADVRFGEPEAGPVYRPYSAIGDIDDYIAFTAEAPGDDWFSGKVPAYLVDDGAADPMEPRVIRSKFAEIIIWASPVWETQNNDLLLAPHPSAMPVYADRDLNYVPDRIVLHQRILLIRPDLNVESSIGAGNLGADATVLRPMNWATASDPNIVPPAMQRFYPIDATFNPGISAVGARLYGNYADLSSNTDNRQFFQSNWLVGMTPIHHFFDLSLRRVIHPQTGDPTGYVAANSLEDLVEPHNRFGHVRYPGRYFGRGDFSAADVFSDNATSMPLLALGWNDTILNWQGTADVRSDAPGAVPPAWFPTSHPSPSTRNTAGTPATTDDSFSGLFNGWLLPHFQLGDPSPPNTSGVDSGHWQRGYLTNADRRWDRTGEDIITSNVLQFDVKAFDSEAPVFMTCGPDGQPGRAGQNDDNEGAADDTTLLGTGLSSELGIAGSDDLMVKVTDIGIYDLVARGILDLNSTIAPGTGDDANFFSRISSGDFVDIFYPYLAGSPLRDRMRQAGGTFPPTPTMAGTANATVITNYTNHLQSGMAGLGIPYDQLSSVKRSGKLLHFNAGGGICYFQPVYDTWTQAYENDGFDQSQTNNGRVEFRTPTSGTGPPVAVGTTWILNNVAGLTVTPRLQSPTATERLFQIDSSRYSPYLQESSPPISGDLEALQVTLRLLDPATNEMMQFSVVEGLQ